MDTKSKGTVSDRALLRMPAYYQAVRELAEQGADRVSAPALAKKLGLGEVQVRKDLSAVSESGGRPRTGFDVTELLEALRRCLGYDKVTEAVLIGAGRLGKTLLEYGGFEDYGIKIAVAFDMSPPEEGVVAGKQIFAMEKLEEICRQMRVHIGIIAVPASAAQEVCNRMVTSGILAVWNFAPVHLSAPRHVLVRNENLAASLALLSRQMTERVRTRVR